MSFFRYPGGKSKLKNRIVEKISEKVVGRNLEYREPFFGGGSIGIAVLQEFDIPRFWMNDKDIGLSALWTSVAKYHEELKLVVNTYMPMVHDFWDFKEFLMDCPIPSSKTETVYTGLMKLAIHQISFSGLGTMSGGPLGGADQKSNYKIDCRWSPSSICRKIDKIHLLFDDTTIRQGGCSSQDFTTVISDELHDCFLYLDPPYYDKGGELYQHSFSHEDHENLRDLLKETPFPWVLSYDDCPVIRNMYDWSEIEEVDINYTISTSRTKSELIISSKEG